LQLELETGNCIKKF